MEDLRKLTGYELERRFASLEADLASKDFELSQRFKKIEALQTELRAAQDSLAKLESVDPPPTWTPPASLPDGEYVSTDEHVIPPQKIDIAVCENVEWGDIYRDWSDPDTGRWQVKDGKATYLGEA